MKAMRMFCFVWMLVVCLVASASRKEIERPCFILANTSAVEIRKVIVTDACTQVEAVLYGEPGSLLVLPSDLSLSTGGREYLLQEPCRTHIAERAGKEAFSASGRSLVSFSFDPVPSHTHELDFVARDVGWKIWGVQLTKSEPYVYVPSFLKSRIGDLEAELPEPALKAGQSVINGYLLGYDSSMEADVVFSCADWMFPEGLVRSVKVLPDGSFHIQTDCLTGTMARLKVNKASLNLFLLPGEETTVYIHLPRLSMSASKMLGKKYRNVQKAWYDGSCRMLNEELATWDCSLRLTDESSLGQSEAAQVDAKELKNRLEDLRTRRRHTLPHDKKSSRAYRSLLEANWEVDASCLLARQGMIADTPASPFAWYAWSYAGYLDAAGMQQEIPAFWKDIVDARAVLYRCMNGEELSPDGKKLIQGLKYPAIRKLAIDRIRQASVLASYKKAAKGGVVQHLDTLLRGEDILPAIIAPYRGRAVLVDFWATWCGPCRKSEYAMKSLKNALSGHDIAYLYLTGPTSPELIWKSALADMNGMHYRLTKQQWDDLCKAYSVTGIPAYLVIGHDGKLEARYVGFPGVDVLQKDLLRASGH